MSNDDEFDFMEPKVREVFERGQIAKERQKDIRYRVDGFVKHLVSLHPDHISVIRRQLEGAAQMLLSEQEAAKRKAREEKQKNGSNGSSGHQGVHGGGNGVSSIVQPDVGAEESSGARGQADEGGSPKATASPGEPGRVAVLRG